MSNQKTLDELIPIFRKVIREEVQPLKRLIREQRQNLSFEQERADEAVEKAERLEESVMAMKARRTLEHSSVLYHDNQAKFADIRKKLYNCVLHHLWDNWSPKQSPRGIPVADIIAHAKLHPWAEGLSDETLSRRVRELHDPMRLLSRPYVGFYQLSELTVERMT